MVEPLEVFAISCMGINELGCILIDGVDVVIGCVTTTVCTITGDSEIVTSPKLTLCRMGTFANGEDPDELPQNAAILRHFIKVCSVC